MTITIINNKVIQ